MIKAQLYSFWLLFTRRYYFVMLYVASWFLLGASDKNLSSAFTSRPYTSTSIYTKHIAGKINQHHPANVLYSSNEERVLQSSTEEKVTENVTNHSRGTVTILSRGPNHVIAMKPPSVVCHHSTWSGSKKRKLNQKPEIPMLQRVRDAIDSIDNNHNENGKLEDWDYNNNENRPMKKVNLVHRLDRGASGILLFAFADNEENSNDMNEEVIANQQNQLDVELRKKLRKKGPTATLQAAMAEDSTIKTYVAIVRGEGILHGEDLKKKGWFEVNRPIKDEKGRLNDASTLFRFVAGQAEPQGENVSDDERIQQPRVSIVLARPKDGRWHQIRRHLNGLSHPILGDTSHGSSKTNREWKEKRNLPGERICLHLARLEMLPTKYTPAIDCSCPLPSDMLHVLQVYASNVLKEAMEELENEGILLNMPEKKYVIGRYKVPDEMYDILPNDDVKILCSTDNYVVVYKPPGVVVHDSAWTRGRKNEALPMVQQVRNATNRKVNPIHRLDRSASGCLLFSFADNDKAIEVTNALINSLQSGASEKIYIALCDGDGKWNEEYFLERGWFTIDQPVKDENGKATNAITDILFVAGLTLPSSDDEDGVIEGRKISLVLVRPKTGKYHQIRQHLASGTIGHAILGDSSHGRSRTNRIWKEKRGLIKERTCLHLIKMKLPATKYSPNGINCTCPLPNDLRDILLTIPELLESAQSILLEEELILLDGTNIVTNTNSHLTQKM